LIYIRLGLFINLVEIPWGIFTRFIFGKLAVWLRLRIFHFINYYIHTLAYIHSIDFVRKVSGSMDRSEQTPEFLITRLAPPPLGRGFVPRPRLLALLDQAGSVALTLVIAPAGSGKSSLLAEWAGGVHTIERTDVSPAKSSRSFAWLSLDEGDNDPVRFWRYFTAALQTAVPGPHFRTPVSLPQLGPGVLPGSLEDLCNALAAWEKPLFLVLDDAQRIENPEICTSLAYLLDHQPANFHLVISSRADPPLPLTRLRAKNRLLEIRARALNFTEEELILFFQEDPLTGRAGILQAANLARGWAAGLRLLKIALAQEPDQVAAWVVGRKLAAEYLTGEIIDRIPPARVDFLQKIAVLDPVMVETAEAMTGDPQAGRFLDEICQENLFVERQGGLFQFHPFFREALLQKLGDPERRSNHKQAAVWFEAHSQPEKAVTHALAGQEWEQAARLILAEADSRFRRGEVRTLESWVGAFPAEVLAGSADLQVLLGWIWYFLGQVPQAIELESELWAPQKQASIQRKSWWAGLRCQLALVQERNREALELAQQALAETDPAESFIRGLLLTYLASAQQAVGDSDGAVIHFKQALLINRQTGNRLAALMALASLGIELNEQGHRLRALELCSEALNDLAGTPDEDHPLSGIVDLLLARLHWEGDLLDDAQTVITRGTQKLAQLGVPGIQLAADLLQVEILAAVEEYGEALKLANLNRRRARTAEFTGFRQFADMLRAEISLKMGNLAAVEDWLEGSNLPASPEEDPAREDEFIVKARYLLESGALEEAGQLLDDLDGYARRGRRVRVLISTLLIRAALEWKKGELGRVKPALEEALALAVPEGYIRLLLDSGALLLGLLAQLPGAPSAIRTRFRSSQPAEIPELVEVLTARELDVLRLLAENNTNQEIARKLVLSAETVKVHLKHIFQKLDVADRRQAVRRARELEII
jgi:LuxR family maltose regulon positive regulatory protein